MFYMYHGAISILIMVVGLYIAMSSRNLIKKLIGLNIFQVSALLLYISLAHIDDAIPPVLKPDYGKDVVYHNPLPHVLMLTAIVVSISTIVVGLAMICRIHHLTGSMEVDGIRNNND
ncbi:Cation:proton antiporter subunit C [Candidatus Xenohaliotis californiensis]|uniref:Cation:proton antiporter subunit C n=1 Tax=Candidatus Xenohaliotis californiensis TaxID=84677 RepID=A0ABM9N7U0_9RICK|nr:Cation:proton antiporter subunit C [Candidatus Xenohaliotis californiensis]